MATAKDDLKTMMQYQQQDRQQKLDIMKTVWQMDETQSDKKQKMFKDMTDQLIGQAQKEDERTRS